MSPLPAPLSSYIAEFRLKKINRHVLIAHALKVTVWRDYALRNIKAMEVPYI